MNRANAGGILLIGIGVVLLNLAYSGRGLAVWQALTSGTASGGGNAAAAPNTATPASDAANAAANNIATGIGSTQSPAPGGYGPDAEVQNPVFVFAVNQPTKRLVAPMSAITAADSTGMCHSGDVVVGLWHSRDPRNYCVPQSELFDPSVIAPGSGGAGVMLPALGYVGEGGSVTWMDRVWS